MNNLDFLDCVAQSFKKFLETHSRSNQKLKILHGKIASDLASKLGKEYTIKSLGFEKGKEAKIQGRYVNKNVDITIMKKGIEVAGIAVKFVMQNYSQNSNNYFENMLGETANIRANNIPYFQVLILPEEMPYYTDKGKLKKWDSVSSHHIGKYRILSEDSIDYSIHTPSKTLLYIVKFPSIENKSSVKNKKDYTAYYLSLPKIEILTTNADFGKFVSNVIFNNYEDFIQKIMHRILSI